MYFTYTGPHRIYTGITQELGLDTFLGQILIPTSPKTSQNVFKLFLNKYSSPLVPEHHRTFLNHILGWLVKMDFLCIFPLHHHTGITQEIGYRPIQIPFLNKYSSPIVPNHHCSIKKRLYSFEPH